MNAKRPTEVKGRVQELEAALLEIGAAAWAPDMTLAQLRRVIALVLARTHVKRPE